MALALALALVIFRPRQTSRTSQTSPTCPTPPNSLTC